MAVNYTGLGLDLQAVVKRAYDNLLYRSSFMNFVNANYIGEVRQTGTPMIEIMRQKAVNITTASATPDITSALTPTLASYDQVKVDLTELRCNYSINISPLVSNIAQAISGQMDLEDSAIAKAIDTYGYDKVFDNTTQSFTWNPSTQQDYIDNLNTLRSTLFNKDVYDDYRLGLEAVEYGKFVSALTSILKYETLAGKEGVDRGTIANAYGIACFPINTNVLTNSEKGYFASEVGIVGDAFFTQFNQWNGDRPGFPGMISIEGIVLFGANVVQPNAVIKLVASASA